MPRRNNPEELLQRSVVEYLRWTKPNCVWFFVNNGARMSKAQAGIGKALGVLPGVADLVFVLDGGQAAFIELKAKGKGLSSSQKLFRADVEYFGTHYAIARSLVEVKETLDAWGVTFAHTRGRAA